MKRTAVQLACLLVLCAAPAAARQLPSQPLAFDDGRVTIGGTVSATYGSDDTGFFNFTDYDRSELRMLRFDVTGAVNAGPHFAVLGELRTENFDAVRPYALYVRIHPWTSRDIDIQAGRVPPTFGAFARRTYGSDNPLIGYPLAYQYLTTMRADALPATADELLAKRGSGWLLRYSVGDNTPDRGLPLVSAFRWDTGVQAHARTANGAVSGTVAVTAGTVSNPLFNDDNGGRQVAGRLELRPTAGLIVGTSVARGAFLADAAARSASQSDGRAFAQTAWGADAEYSRGYYLLRFETIVSAWDLPIVRTPALTLPLRAASTSLEGRYKIVPGLYAAARVDHLGFSEIAGSTRTAEWDAPVTRTEVGAGYSIQRNLLVKVSWQRNRRDGGHVPNLDLGAAQVVFWF